MDTEQAPPTGRAGARRAGPSSAARRGRARWAVWRRADVERFVFPAPAVVLVLVMLAFPVGYTVFLSFHEWSGGLRPPQFVGGGNFSDLWADGRAWDGVWHTVYFVVLSVGLQVVVGVGAALVFARPFVGRGVARTFFMFPMIATPAAMAMVWKMLYDPTIGSLSYIVHAAGGPTVEWTTNPALVIPALAVVDTWEWTPLVMVIVAAGLAALPTEPFEAARIDGASVWQTFTRITVPLLRPVLVVAVMFRAIDCIKTFDIIMIITAGGPGYASETLNVYAFNEGLSYLHLGYASALLIVLTVLVFAVAIVFNRIQRRQVQL